MEFLEEEEVWVLPWPAGSQKVFRVTDRSGQTVLCVVIITVRSAAVTSPPKNRRGGLLEQQKRGEKTPQNRSAGKMTPSGPLSGAQ